MKSQAGAARRYARALVAAAGRDEAALAALAAAAAATARALDVPAARDALADPVRAAALVRALGGLLEGAPALRGLLPVLVRRRRLGLLPEVAAAVGPLVDAARGIVPAEVTAAVEVPADARAGLEATISRTAGVRIRAAYRVDPAVVGGLVVRVGDRRYDASVEGNLRRFAARFAE